MLKQTWKWEYTSRGGLGFIGWSGFVINIRFLGWTKENWMEKGMVGLVYMGFWLFFF